MRIAVRKTRSTLKTFCTLMVAIVLLSSLVGRSQEVTLGGWRLQDAARVEASASQISMPGFSTDTWYKATVPGTVLTTLVDSGVYPEPLYGENMRAIPESLNKADYWYRAEIVVPPAMNRAHTWLHFGGVNYAADVWVNGELVGAIKGAFLRGDFDISSRIRRGHRVAVAVLVHPQPNPGVPHEHTQALGLGRNGGVTAIDGPTFLATIGWDWMPAIRDRDSGIWQPVTLSSTGPVVLRNPYVTSQLSAKFDSADLNFSTELENKTSQAVDGDLVGTITGDGREVKFRKHVTVEAGANQTVSLDAASTLELHIANPKLWWPNGYGEPNLYSLALRFEAGHGVSDRQTTSFGIRKVEYEVPGSDNLTLVVNGVKVMVRGGDWGMDEAMKRIPRERLEAQIRMHQIANLNMIRNWVGQSTSPDLYDLADKYGILLWDEFFQPNPSDGPNPTDIPTYLANVTDKVLRFRNHPSIVVWCARNEGHPPKELDDALSKIMATLDPTRLYQSSSTDGRGVSSHGPYYWRAPRFFYQINEAFKTETGSVSVPTLESIQGMMPQKDWESINDDWAQHDMAAGAQRGDQYPSVLAQRFGPIRNLADFVRKAQLANYEAFRAMYESRNSDMFTKTTGVLTWMSNPAQPSFVWQLYHYDLEPNSALYGAKKASESIHVQFNEADRDVEIVNNRPTGLRDLKVRQTIYRFDGTIDTNLVTSIDEVAASSTKKLSVIWVNPHITEIYFIKLDLTDADGKLLSTNFYWQNVAQDDYTGLNDLARVKLDVNARAHVSGAKTMFEVTIHNPTEHVAVMTHLQLHRKASGKRVLPVFYSDNYLSLVPGESRNITIEAATKDVAGEALLLVDGYNVDVNSSDGPVAVKLNENAQPMHWPASTLVPAPSD
jgi:mannosylglycoprotein endo-beta-mannosidase